MVCQPQLLVLCLLQGLCLWSGALSLAALLGCTPSEALDVLAVSAVSVGMLHLVMVCLPHTFTLGEGMVVSQVRQPRHSGGAGILFVSFVRTWPVHRGGLVRQSGACTAHS